MVEFSRARRKKLELSASSKCAHVGGLGKYETGVLKSSVSGVMANRSAQEKGKSAHAAIAAIRIQKGRLTSVRPRRLRRRRIERETGRILVVSVATVIARSPARR